MILGASPELNLIQVSRVFVGFGGSGVSVGFEPEKRSLVGKVCLLVSGSQDWKSVIGMRLVQLG